MAKNLIIYYSRKGENYVNGRIENLKKGNTEICAEYIQKAVISALHQPLHSTFEHCQQEFLHLAKRNYLERRLRLHRQQVPTLDKFLSLLSPLSVMLF